MYLHRAEVIRAMRRRLLVHYGFAAAPSPPPQHSILVLQKVQETARIDVPDLCTSTQRLSQQLFPRPAVVCESPALQNVKEQLLSFMRASVVVVEHGSTAYSSLFQMQGSALLVIAPSGAPELKEPQVLLSNVDVQTWYSTIDEYTASPGLLLLALERVGGTWRLDQVRVSSSQK